LKRRTFINLGLTGLATTVAAASPVAMQFIPAPSKEKWAVLFGTWHGTARDASVWVSEGMGGIAAVFDIRQVPADLLAYDHLIIGTAIHGGKGPQALEDYISRNLSPLQGKIRGLFAVCGNRGKLPGPPQVKAYIDDYLARLCGLNSVPHRVFGGRITQVLMAPAEYKAIADMYARIGGPSGDWDNLSRVECLNFGKEIYAAKA
jgi:menaquinone-dependent protoporphyrinogen IX oxidase